MSDILSGFVLLDPKGAIGAAELQLMVQATLFMLIVAVPVFILLFFFAWHYRAGNKKAKYLPDWEHAKVDELIWWAIPFEIVLILGALTWTSTAELDPKKPLATSDSPLVVQVVALEWKWLFIYPEQEIATVNYLAMPVGRPVRFEITADAPMNAFWIPELGGMIYAMTGMKTTLHLVAEEAGEYQGLSANYSGEGFAQMKFTADAMSQEDFDRWVMERKTSLRYLSWQEYVRLSSPGTQVAPIYYAGVESGLHDTIVMQFMDHQSFENSPSQAAGHSGDVYEGAYSPSKI